MSHAFDARFSPTSLDLAETLRRLGPCLHESGIDFDGEIMRLHSRGGTPTVMSTATQPVSSLGDVAKHAGSWWGVSLYCLSGRLAEALGRTDSIEVYLRIFQAANAGRMLVYNENSRAFSARAGSDELTRDLAALLVCTSAALDLALSIYAEEDGEATVPQLTELERRLAEQAASPRALGWLAVVASSSMSLARARDLAGPWADRVRLSILDYVVLPFLAGDLDRKSGPASGI